MTWFCTKCGSQNEDSESTCVVCGSGRISEMESQQGVMVQDPGAQQPAGEPAPVPEQQAPPAPVTVHPEEPPEESFLEFQFVQSPMDSLMGKKVKVNFSVFPSVSVGRSPENVMQIPDASVSRMHAKIVLDGGSYYLEDIGSSNGTFLYDGTKFVEIKEKTKIQEKSLVKFGEGTIVKVTSTKAV
ncbi:MAG: FHA domain-containing protein [Thermoplasmataceae archaeon]